MPEAGFNQDLNLPSAGGKFIKLKSKGDKIKFRIAATPHYETKHWTSPKETVFCAKFNGGDKKASCGYCDQYNKLLAADKKDEAKAIAPVTTFYYPVLNFDTDEAAVFQFTAKSIHYGIKSYADNDPDFDVFKMMWVVERTEEPGNYYKILQMGEKKLTPEQEEAYAQAKNIKLKAAESKSVKMEEEEVPPPTDSN